MRKELFENLLAEGNMAELLKDGGRLLSISQMKRVKELGRSQSKDNLMARQYQMAKQPGYRESVLTPVMSQLPAMAIAKKVSTQSKNTSSSLMKLSQEPLSLSEENFSTPEKTLGRIFELIVENDSMRDADRLDDLKYLEEKNRQEQSRHQEILKALTIRRVPKVKKMKKSEKKAAKKAKRVEEPPKTSAAPAPSTTPTPPKPTATPTPPKTPSLPTAAKVGVGVAAAAGAGAAIAGAESGGNYDVTFGDKVKNGQIVNQKGFATPESMYGRKLTDLTLEEVNQLGKYRNSVSPNSSAMGKYQFMNTTLFGRTGKDGKQIPGLVQQLKLDMNTKFSKEVQDKLYELLHSNDIATLKRLGVPITPGYEYMAHYIGAAGAAAVYNRREQNMSVADAMKEANLTAPGKANNPELYEIKTSNFEKVLEGRLTNHGLASPHSSGQGDKMYNVSNDNTNRRNEMSNMNSSGVVNNTQVSIQNGGQPNQTPTGNDKSAYEIKKNSK